MGAGRAREMAVSCVLPFCHALGRSVGDVPMAELALSTYREAPLLQENRLTREMQHRLLSHLDACGERDATRPQGRKSIVCSARRQQGLLHLHALCASPRTLRREPSG